MLTQRKYIRDILQRANMENCKTTLTLMASIELLSKTYGALLSDKANTNYISIVGVLQYLTITQPDISFTVNRVCQCLHILRYLKHTLDLGLDFSNSSSLLLSAFLDLDWASCPNDCKSTSGFVVSSGSNIVS